MALSSSNLDSLLIFESLHHLGFLTTLVAAMTHVTVGAAAVGEHFSVTCKVQSVFRAAHDLLETTNRLRLLLLLSSRDVSSLGIDAVLHSKA